MKHYIITGSSGLVGTSLCRKLKFDVNNFVMCMVSSKVDLRDDNQVNGAFETIIKDNDWRIFHLAARVGGIKANNSFATFFRDNVLINTNVLHNAALYNVEKVVSLASTCVYPKDARQPLQEKDLHNGFPHDTNYAYAFAKRMIDIQSKAYRDSYKCNFVTAIPTNVYGLNDNFDLENSHVIPAIIHKVYLAKKNNQRFVELWGDGQALRDFIFSDDLSDALILIMEKYNDREAINIATGVDVTIEYVTSLIMKALNFHGGIIWNGELKGIDQKSTDITKIKSLGWEPKVKIEEGIQRVCEWFEKNYKDSRGAII